MKNFDEKDMYDNAYDCLRRRYPSNQGWVIYPQDHHGTYIPDFVVEKKTSTRTIKVVAEVKKCVITQTDITQINEYARNLAGPTVTIQEKIFIVASGPNTSLVNDDFKIIYLKDFECIK